MEEQLVEILRRAVSDLLYSSDTDAPFEVLFWPECPAPLTVSQILTPREARGPADRSRGPSVEQFFAPLTADQKWYGAEERRRPAVTGNCGRFWSSTFATCRSFAWAG